MKSQDKLTMSLINQFVEYLYSQDKRSSKATVKNYKADIGQFLRWFESNYQNEFDPKNVTLKIIENYKQARLASQGETLQDKTISAISVDRHLSSLRKFFIFLKLEGYISRSPFESEIRNQKSEVDVYRLKDFKNFLYVYNASRLTIKNYIIDIKQFFVWAEEVLISKDSWSIKDRNIYDKLNSKVIEEYKQRLIDQHFSPLTVNRKLSSLRKYFAWAQEENLLPGLRFNVQNTKSDGKTILQAQALEELKNKQKSNKPVLTEEEIKAYSKIPPIRMFQKIKRGIDFTFDKALFSPIAGNIKKAEYFVWKLKGKPIFQKLRTEDLGLKRFLSRSLSLGHQSSVIRPIGNIKKEFYAPLTISTVNFPLHKKVIHHLRYTRPNWYKTYHSYAITHYFHFAILIIFMSAIGFSFYNEFIVSPQVKNPALAALPTAPPRILSFQGRLTDNSDNPVSSPTAMRFAIYNNLTASGAALLWQEIDTVSPDPDGIFSILLGNNTAIPSTLFTENASLYLGVTVTTTPELTPRQQLATVAYAANAETLQGLLPITAGGAGTTNVVLALDSSGNLSIGGSATPVFQATGGQFTVSGNVLNLTTVSGTNSNIQLNPDGLGKIDLQKPIQNTSLNNNIPSAAGAVEIDDRFAILATSSGQSAFTLNQNGNGDLISASSSGVPKFTVGNTGTITSGSVIPLATSTYDLGSSSYYWNNLYVNNIVGASTGVQGYWQRNSQAVAPTNITDDVLIGATSTASALIKLTGTSGNNSWINTGNVGIGTTNPGGKLEVYGSLRLRGDGSTYHTITPNGGELDINPWGSGVLVQTANSGGVGLAIKGSSGQTADLFRVSSNTGTGDILSVKGGGNVGIGTTAPAEKLDVNGKIIGRGDLWLRKDSSSVITFTDAANSVYTTADVYASNYKFRIGATEKITIDAGGQLGIGTTSPLALLDVAGAATIGGQLTFDAGNTIQTTAMNTLVLGGNTTGNIVLNPANAAAGGAILPNTTNVTDIGSSSLQFRNIYATNFIGGTSGVQGLWQRTSGSLAPTNITDDVLLGATATSSALIKLSGTSGNNSWINTGNVGIGTTAPASKLDVNGDISLGTGAGTPTINFRGASNTNYIQKISTNVLGTDARWRTSSGTLAAPGWSFVDDDNTGIHNPAADTLSLVTGGADRLYITSTGNVGIGTTNPQTTLHVYSNSTNPIVMIEAGASGSFPALDLKDGRTSGVQWNIENGRESAGTLGFYMGGTRMVIKSDGNVGIGTTSPGKLLTIVSANNGGTMNTGTAVMRIVNSGDAAADSRFTGIQFAHTDVNNQVTGAIGTVLTDTATQWAGDMVFGVKANGSATTLSEYMRIQVGGNVGIGTTSPLEKLDVSGNATVSGNLVLAGGARTIQTTAMNTLVLGGNTTGNIVLNPGNAAAGGAILPNTTNVTDIGSSSLQFRNIYANNFIGGTSGVQGLWQRNVQALSPTNITDDVLLGATATSSALIKLSGTSGNNSWINTGNVGIGTTNPGANLDINGTTYSRGNLWFFTGASDIAYIGPSSGYLTFQNRMPNYGFQFIGHGVGTEGYMDIQMPIRNSSATLGGGIVKIEDTLYVSGNVGIGTTSPVGKLHVSGTAGNTALVTINETGSNDIFTASQGGTTKFVINNAGNVGIGNTDPHVLLNIGVPAVDTAIAALNAVPNGQLLLGRQVTNGGALSIGTYGGSYAWIQNRSRDGDGNSYPLVLNPLGGNVGIGTTSPNDKLDVQGGNIIVGNNYGLTVTKTDGSRYNGFLLDNSNLLWMRNPWGDITFGYGVTRNMTILGSTGNVGIGTTSPIAPFQVHVASNTNLGILTRRANNSSISSFNDAGNGFQNLDIDAGIIALQANSGGNVGIGTTSPLALLDVAGAATIGGQLTFDAGNTIQTTGMNTLTLGGATTGNIVLNPANAAAGGAVLPNTTSVTDIGSSSLQFRNIYATNFIGGTSGVQGLWQRTSGSLAPTNITDDVLLGATATSSALIKLTGTSGNNSWINTGNVGIGTTSPTAQLTVEDADNYFQLAQKRTGSNQTLWSGAVWDTVGSFISNNAYYQSSFQFIPNYTAASGISFRESGNIEFFADSGLTAGVLYNPTERMTLSTAGNLTLHNGVLSVQGSGNNYFAGNVGIGTTSPLALLDVAGAATIGGQLTFDAGNTIQTTAMNTLVLGGSTTGNIVLNPANAAAGGAILPNTTNATDIGSSSLQFRNIYATNFIGGTSGVQGLWQRNTQALSPTNITDDLLLGATATSSALIKLSGTSGNNSWINTGNVGIGTTSPGAKLDIAAGTAATYATRDTSIMFHRTDYPTSYGNKITNSMSGTIANTTMNFELTDAAGTGFTNIMTLRGDGNVGIGTTAPNAKLNVYTGAAGISPASASDDLVIESNTDAGISLLGPTTANQAIYFGDTGSNLRGAVLYDHTNDAMRLYAAGVEKVRINSDGNVGIGTTGPSAKLTIKDLGGAFAAEGTLLITRAAGATGDGSEIRFQYGETNRAYQTAIRSIVENYGVTDASTLQFLTQATGNALTARMSILGNGNVGIGTTNPQTTLHVYSNSTNPIVMVEAGASGSFPALDLKDGRTSGVQWNIENGRESAGTLGFYMGGTRMVIKSDGNVGIGTTNPASFKLEVAGNIGPDATGTRDLGSSSKYWNNIYVNNIIGASSGTQGYWQRAVNGAIAPTYLADDVLVGGNSTASAYIKLSGTSGNNSWINTGNVGIGTTAPSSKLEVNGNVELTNLYDTDGTNFFDTTGSASQTLTSIDSTGALSFSSIAIAASQVTSGEFNEARVRKLESADTRAIAELPSDFTSAIQADFKQNSTNGLSDGGTYNGVISFRPYGSTTDWSGGPMHQLGFTSNNNMWMRTSTGSAGFGSWRQIASNGMTNNFSFMGNVGVGTAGPDRKLDILDGTGNPQLRLSSTDGSKYSDIKTDQMGYLSFAPTGLIATMTATLNPNADATYDLGSASRHWANLYVDNLIGTTVASNEWQRISGALSPRNITDDVLTGSNATSSALIKLSGTSGNNSWINTGNVGIGTTSPIAKFQVNGAIYATPTNSNTVMSGSPGGDYQMTLISNGGYWGLRQATNNSYNLDVYNGGSPLTAMTVLQGGNVGIGTTNPTSLLTVNQTSGQSAVRLSSTTDGGSIFKLERYNSNGNYFNLETGNANRDTFEIYPDGVTGFVMNTTGNVGIGTTSPVGKLHVSGTAGNTALVTINETGTNDIFTASQGGAMKFVINNAGNVGIGTTNPRANLDISGLNKAVNSKGNLFISSTDSLAIDKGGQVTLGGNWSTGSTQTGFGAIAGRKENGSDGSAAGYLSLYTSISAGGVLTEQMRITSTGNVGIGATNPTKKLEIAGDVLTTGSSRTLQIGNTGTAFLYFSNTNNSIEYASNQFRFVTNQAQGFTFNGGNVGIGTTSPLALLDVAGAATIGGQLTFDAGNAIQTTAMNTLTLGGATTGNIVLNPANAAAGGAILPNTNNVTDIGSSSLQFRNIYASNFIGGTSGVQGLWQRTSGSLAPTNITDDVLLGATATSSALIKLTGTSGNNSWINTGNVGIGTTSPAQKLDVVGYLRSGNVITDATNKYGIFLARHYTNSEEDIANLSSESLSNATNLYIGGGIAGSNAATNLRFYTATNNTTTVGTEKMRIDSAGNVGIGTTNPGAKLEVSAGNILLSNNYAIQGLTTGAAVRNLIKLENTANMVEIGSGDRNIYLNTGASSNVGIGTTSPTFKLDIETAASGSWATRIYNSHATAGYGLQVRAGNDATNKIVEFRDVNDAAKVTILGNGNVGIGTTSPLALLDVAGAATIGGQLTFDAGNTIQTTAMNTLTLGGATTGNIVLNPANAAAGGAILPNTTNVTDIGSSSLQFRNIYANNFIGGTSGVQGLWQRNTQALSPTNITDDVLLGATATSSALIKLTGTSGNNSWINTGNVGIGTTNPLSKLDIRADAFTYNSVLFGTGAGGVDLPWLAFNAFTTGSYGATYDTVNASWDGGMIKFSPSNSDTVTNFSIGFVDQDTAAYSEAMRIRKDGNVGIGTTSPTSKLTVNSGDIEFTTAGQYGFRWPGGSRLYEQTTAQGGAERMLYQPNGDRFEVLNEAGNAFIAGFHGASSSLANSIRLYNGVAIGNVAGYAQSGSVPSNGLIVSGNVGIGTTGPGQKLDVNGFGIFGTSGTAAQQVSIGQVSNYPGIWFAANTTAPSTSNYAFLYDSNAGKGTTLNTPSTMAIGFRVNNVDKMRLSPSGGLALGSTYSSSATQIEPGSGNMIIEGNVGIGTTSPLEKLDVSGNATISGNLILAGGARTIQATDMNSLTLGGSNTGFITIDSGNGVVRLADFTTNGGLMYTNASGVLAQLGAGTTAQCLTANTGAAPSWGTCGSSGSSFWQELAGALSPINTNADLLLGGTSTASALIKLTGTSGNNSWINTGNVGIGTTNPSYKLVVNGSITTIGNADLPTSGGTNIYFAGGYASPDAGRFVFGDGTGWKMHFSKRTGGVTTDLLSLQDNGNVGIGTTNPTKKLEIAGDVLTTGSSRTLQIGNTGTAFLYFSNTNNSIEYASNQFRFVTNQAQGFTFNGGNVGIGTTSPLALLDVAGAATIGGQLTFDAGNTIQTTAMNTLTLGGATTGNIVLNPANAAAGGAILPNTNNVTDIGSSSLQFRNIYAANFIGGTSGVQGLWQRTSGSLAPTNITDDVLLGATATSSALIKLSGTSGNNSWINTGNVGIGTTSPAKSLDVRGTGILVRPASDQNEVLQLTNAAGTTYVDFSSLTTPRLELANAANFEIFSDNFVTSKFKVTGSTGQTYIAGNVGIGTTNPAAKLHINAAAYGDPSIRIQAAGAGYWDLVTSYNYTNEDLFFRANGVDVIEFNTSGNIGVGYIGVDLSGGKLLVNGNVGIGTTSPLEKLAVTGNATISGTLAVNTIKPPTGALSLQYKSGANAWSNALTILDNTGNVGIGTTSPLALTHIESSTVNSTTVNNGNMYMLLKRAVDANAGIGIGFVASTGSTVPGGAINFLRTGSNGRGDIALYTKDTADNTTAPSERLRILSGGNVGIGTTAPIGLLNVNGAPAGKALTILNYTSTDQNILTASTSGVTKFNLTNAGVVQASSFYDLDNTSYFLDPAAVGTSLATVGTVSVGTASPLSSTAYYADKNSLGNTLMVLNQQGTGDLIAASASGSVKFLVKNNGDVVVGNGGTGKLTATTIDPLYTIDGTRYSTYGTSMVGVKEEVTGKITLSYNAEKQAYAETINLNNQPIGSDLWLFSRVIDPNIDLVSILLTPDSSAKVWYEKNVSNKSITFYSDSPTGLSYRLTAPRFDHLAHGNLSDETDPTITGLIVPPPPSTDGLPVATIVSTASANLTNGQFAINVSFDNLGKPVYELIDSLGNVIKKTGSYSEILAANIKAGLITAKDASFDSLILTTGNITIAGDSLQNYIASIVEEILNSRDSTTISPLAAVDKLNVNVISPLAKDANVEIALNGENSKLEVKNSSGSAVASIDEKGKLSANEASIAGTLRAKKIIADEIEGLNMQTSTLSAQYITNNNYYVSTPSASSENAQSASSSANTQLAMNNGFVDIASFSGQLGYIENLSATYGKFTQGLMAFGPSSFADVSIAGQFSIGGQMILYDNSINVLGADLQIQPLRQGGINFLSGLLTIDNNGNIEGAGNATFRGTLFAGIISPVPGQDLIVKLNSSEAKDAKFEIRNASNSAILTVNQAGDLIASGAATFGKLNLNLASHAFALSNTEAIATGSAGIATISARQKELTINNDLITEKSLIYITPIGSANGLNPYLLRQVPNKSFTIGVDSFTTQPIQFNWLIIN